MKRKYVFTCLIVVSTALVFSPCPTRAEESVQDLKKQVEDLQKRIKALESAARAEDEVRKNMNTRNRVGIRNTRSVDPFDKMKQIHREMNQLLQDSFFQGDSADRGIFSSHMSFDTDLDIKETADGYEVLFDMTGFDQEKVDIQIDEHSVTVQGENASEDVQEQENQYYKSQSYGSFMKTIPLPLDADTSNVKTEKKGALLIIKIPKKDT